MRSAPDERVIHCHSGALCHVYHWLGVDTQRSPFYDAWSGVVPCVIAVVGLALVWWSIRLEIRALKLETQLIRAQFGADEEDA